MKGVSLEDERAALVLEAKELREALIREWVGMSWQEATQRRDRLEAIDNRIALIDRSIARRKRS